jgi:hypothetical protein
MIALADRSPQDWKPPIVRTVAYEHRGIDDLLEAIDRFRVSQVETGRGQERRIARARREVESIALAKLRAEFPWNGTAGLDDLAKAVSRVSWIPTPRPTECSSAAELESYEIALAGGCGPTGGVPAPNMRTHRVESEYPGVSLYMRQGVRIVCGEDRKDE